VLASYDCVYLYTPLALVLSLLFFDFCATFVVK